MSKLVDLSGLRRGSRAPGGVGPALPLAPCNTRPAPSWRLERLSQDRFRLIIAVPEPATEDIEVFIAGGLLHVEDTVGALDCAFLLLEPLSITRVERREGELVIELERDHAWPCKAAPPPLRREDISALALAA